MKTRLLSVLLALVAGSGVAEAQGFNVAWDVCPAAGGAAEKILDCADLAAVDDIVVTFSAPGPLPGFVGLEATLGVTGTSPLPDFWQFGDAGCNAGGLTLSLAPPLGGGCADPWTGAGTGILYYETPVAGDPARANIHVWASRTPTALLGGIEYFGFRVRIDHAGAAACAGCDVKVYVNVHQVRVLDRLCPAPMRGAVFARVLSQGQIAANTTLLNVDPPAAGLSLAGTLRNPVAGGDAVVRFSLPDASPAWLELIDVAGRRVLRREVGSLGAGSHQVRLSEGGAIAPGVYQLRLTNGHAARVRKTVIVR